MQLLLALAIFCAVIAACALVGRRFDVRCRSERRLTPPPQRATGWRGR